MIILIIRAIRTSFARVHIFLNSMSEKEWESVYRNVCVCVSLWRILHSHNLLFTDKFKSRARSPQSYRWFMIHDLKAWSILIIAIFDQNVSAMAAVIFPRAMCFCYYCKYNFRFFFSLLYHTQKQNQNVFAFLF